MFLQSVINGIFALADWHILVGILCVGFVTLCYPICMGLIIGEGESRKRTGLGFLFILLGGPLVQVIAVSVFILICLPAIIGEGGFTPLTLIQPLAWPIFKAGLIAMVIILLLCFFPLIGHFVANTPGVPVFLQGIIMLKPITRNVYYSITEGDDLPNNAFPSFWHCVGYVLIGLVLCYLALFFVFLIADYIEKKRDPVRHIMSRYYPHSPPSGLTLLLGMIIGPVFGILPLLMYGRYISASLFHN